MSENDEPDWLPKLAKGGEAGWRQVDLPVPGVVQLVRTGWPKTVSLALPSPLRLTAAADADVRVLKLAPPPAYVRVPQARDLDRQPRAGRPHR